MSLQETKALEMKFVRQLKAYTQSHFKNNPPKIDFIVHTHEGSEDKLEISTTNQFYIREFLKSIGVLVFNDTQIILDPHNYGLLREKLMEEEKKEVVVATNRNSYLRVILPVDDAADGSNGLLSVYPY